MSIRAKIALTILLFVVFITVGIFFISQAFMLQNIDIAANETIKDAQESFSLLEERDLEQLQSVNEVIRSRSDLQELFIAGDREGLHEAVSPLFETLRDEYGITHLYFIEGPPSSEVFLRVQKKDKFGDVVGRESYTAAVASGSWATGKDMGKVRIALRAIHPWVDVNGDVVGYVEVAQEIEEFLDVMSAQTSDEYALLLRKDFVREEDWAEFCETHGHENNWGAHDEFVIVHATDEQVDEDDLVELSIEQVTKESTSYRSEVENGREYIVGAFPVEDFAGNAVAAVVVEHDASGLYAQYRSLRFSVVLVVLVAGLLLMGAVFLLLNGLVFGRLDTMVEHMERASLRIAGGDFDIGVPEVVSSDEISKFERFFGDFLGAVANTLRQFTDK